jgi:GntR family transcriptional regulator
MDIFEIEKIDPDISVPLYIQAEHIVRRLIRRPEYADGENLLPNELELSEAIGVSRSTMREAMNKLVFEGLLVRKKGLGTRVTASQVKTKAKNWFIEPDEFSASGLDRTLLDVEVGWERTPRPVALFYGIPEKRSVIKVERLYEFDDAKVHVCSWLNPRVGLRSHMDFENTSVYELLKQSGIELGEAREEISAKVPEPWVYRKLGIKPGSIAIFRRRFVRDVNGKPVEYRLEIYDAARFVIEYVMDGPKVNILETPS